MEEANKKYDRIYSIFKEHQNNLKDYGVTQWSKLDPSALLNGADKQVSLVKKLGSKLPGAESMSPFIKLRETIIGFRESLPLIEMLKNPAIQERHWKRIMEETGKEGGEINLKTLTLNKVFELELQNYEEKVTEICNEAKEESKNEESIAKIEVTWKSTNFEIAAYKKGNEHKGWALKSPDEVKTTLEDNILTL